MAPAALLAVAEVYALRATKGGVLVGAMHDPDPWARGAGSVVTINSGREPHLL